MELSGSGHGYGDADADGGGYGYGGGGGGYGDEKKHYLELLLAAHPIDAGCVAGFWRSRADGTPANGGDETLRARVGQVQEVPGPLCLCERGTLHATRNPEKWEGERWWVVALYPPIASEENKLGSLKRKIIADLGKCPF